ARARAAGRHVPAHLPRRVRRHAAPAPRGPKPRPKPILKAAPPPAAIVKAARQRGIWCYGPARRFFMALLVLGLVLFLGVHSVRIFASAWRERMIARLGEKRWRGVY